MMRNSQVMLGQEMIEKILGMRGQIGSRCTARAARRRGSGRA